jgi:hypothetical protein
MPSHILDKSNVYNIQHFHESIGRLDINKKWRIKWEEYTETRSDKQNRLSHAWYAELAENLKEFNALGYKNFCKLHFGVPILRTEDDEFRNSYDKVIRPLSYEQKIEVMNILPVTSIMTTKQLTQYLDAMKAHFYNKQGYDLHFPGDM